MFSLTSTILMAIIGYWLQLSMFLSSAVPRWVQDIGNVFHNTAVANAIITISAVSGLTFAMDFNTDLTYAAAALTIIYALCFTISINIIPISIFFNRSLGHLLVIMVGINLNLLLLAFILHMIILLPHVKDICSEDAEHLLRERHVLLLGPCFYLSHLLNGC
ncbi:hypothetical protein AMTRI_Chr09g42850 [Amborella trichopoda]|uniref:uncharacterized protein LOC110008424 n=1 Tax=Amborella trichopoda TaxID=13333 RepID=UPI0009BE1949|nr:uncharacterized protein LOC110008424 [Amborella trichopoda]|eukprot:XP_020531332.1 uncharacterized protein LOC110008424 [Amborella trichopoda]